MCGHCRYLLPTGCDQNAALTPYSANWECEVAETLRARNTVTPLDDAHRDGASRSRCDPSACPDLAYGIAAHNDIGVFNSSGLRRDRGWTVETLWGIAPSAPSTVRPGQSRGCHCRLVEGPLALGVPYADTRGRADSSRTIPGNHDFRLALLWTLRGSACPRSCESKGKLASLPLGSYVSLALAEEVEGYELDHFGLVDGLSFTEEVVGYGLYDLALLNSPIVVGIVPGD